MFVHLIAMNAQVILNVQNVKMGTKVTMIKMESIVENQWILIV